jgi:LmbE family N-acetylglucosaminyl deacetylase
MTEVRSRREQNEQRIKRVTEELNRQLGGAMNDQPPAFIKRQNEPEGYQPPPEHAAAHAEAKAAYQASEDSFVPPGRQMAVERARQHVHAYETAKKATAQFRALTDQVDRQLDERFKRLLAEEQAFGSALDQTYRFLADSQGLLSRLSPNEGRGGANRNGEKADVVSKTVEPGRRGASTPDDQERSADRADRNDPAA